MLDCWDQIDGEPLIQQGYGPHVSSQKIEVYASGENLVHHANGSVTVTYTGPVTIRVYENEYP